MNMSSSTRLSSILQCLFSMSVFNVNERENSLKEREIADANEKNNIIGFPEEASLKKEEEEEKQNFLKERKEEKHF